MGAPAYLPLIHVPPYRGWQVAHSSIDNKLYFSSGDPQQPYVFSFTPNTSGYSGVTEITPVTGSELVYSHITNKIFTDDGNGVVSIYNPISKLIVDTVTLPEAGVFGATGIQYSFLSRSIYVSNNSYLREIDVNSHQIVSNINLNVTTAARITDVYFTSGSGSVPYEYFYVACYPDGPSGIKVVDIKTNTVVASITASGAMQGDYCPTHDMVFIPNATGVLVINPHTHQVENTIAWQTSGEYWYAAHWNPLDELIYVTVDNTISVIDPGTQKFVYSFLVEPGDWAGTMEYMTSTRRIYSPSTTLSVIYQVEPNSTYVAPISPQAQLNSLISRQILGSHIDEKDVQ